MEGTEICRLPHDLQTTANTYLAAMYKLKTFISNQAAEQAGVSK